MIVNEYSFGKIFIYDCYAVAIMNEGIIVTPENNLALVDISKTHFKNKKFGYISNRINSYSIDPSVYILTSKIENLVGFAIITDDPIKRLNSEVEKRFFKKPFEDFHTLNEGIGWIKSIINTSKETSKR